MASINRLLKKRKWTGKDVGKTFIACLMHDLKNIDKDESTPLISQTEFSRLESSLETEKDFITYRVYIALHDAIREYYNKANSMMQQIYHGFYREYNLLSNSMLAEGEITRNKLEPIILTFEQYLAKAEEAMTKKRAKTRTKADLIFCLLRAYFATLDLESNPDPQEGHYSGHHAPAPIPDAIRKELDTLKQKKATAKKALDAWGEEMLNGSYILPDGRRKADLTPEEWQAALAEYPPAKGVKDPLQRTLLEPRLFYEGAPAIRAFYKESTGEDLPPVEDKALLLSWDSITPVAPSLEDLQENEIEEAVLNTLTTKLQAALDGTSEYVLEWKRYPLEEAVEEAGEVSKFDLLFDALEYYEGKSRQGRMHGGYSVFKKEYAALHAALEKELLAAIPAWQDLKPAQLTKAAISCGELADMGFLDFKEKIQHTDNDVIKACNPASLALSVCIATNEKDACLDKEGNLRKKKLLLEDFTLEALQAGRAYELEASVENLLKPAIRYILAFNAWLEIIAAAYDLPDITRAQIDLAFIEKKIDTLNFQIHAFYLQADNSASRALIKKLFKPVDFDSLYPTEENILKVASFIDGLGYSEKAARAFTLVKIDDYINQIAGN